MAPDFTVSQTALLIIAIAVSIQTLLLVAAAWLTVRLSKELRAEVDRRLNLLEARLVLTSEAAGRMADAVDRCARQVSTILHQGERITGAAVTALATPKALLLAGAASKLVAGWRRRRGPAA